MRNQGLPTEFAPAEKSSKAEIRRQSKAVAAWVGIRKFIDSIPDTVLVLNKNRQIVLANKAAAAFCGLKGPNAATGLRPGELLDCIHASENEGGCGTTKFCSTCGAVKAILSSQRGRASVEECRIKQKQTGDALDLKAHATPLTLGGERFSVYVVSDISHEKRRRLLERMFFHDVMNTMTGLIGYADILGKVTPEQMGEFREAVSHIGSMANVLVEQINAQRDLLAAESNELSVRPVQLDTLGILQELVSQYKNHEVAEERQLVIGPAARSSEFSSDRTLLLRVLGNMVKNALEAASPGDTITLGCATSTDRVEFWVHNPGLIPLTVQLQIFQRSFSTKGANRGVGTYSMRLLSERYLKGRVSFTTSKEKGTVFVATYPRVLGSQEEAQS